uniref:NTR domain-containing protein n=1 Tax=Macrostomum lignano TaxID=282301 RepID=A0A1I8FLM2_9PLAT
ERPAEVGAPVPTRADKRCEDFLLRRRPGAGAQALQLLVGFDGDWSATYWLSGKYLTSGKLEVWRATATDTRAEDEVGSWLSEAGCRPVKRKLRCLSSAAKREAVQPVAVGKKILCASFYLQSRRCARHHKPAVLEHRSGCPIKCGPNEHFTSRASPCPATCGSHFFGTPKKCFHLPAPKAVAGKRGFVLDSSNRCVPPKEWRVPEQTVLDRNASGKSLPKQAPDRVQVIHAVQKSNNKIDSLSAAVRTGKACPSIAKTKLAARAITGKGVRTGKRIVQYREETHHGKHRCLRRVTPRLKVLSAAPNCVKHTELVRVTKGVQSRAEKCTQVQANKPDDKL